MPTHKKTKIEILIEASFEKKLSELLDTLDVKGYTVYPVVSGKGEHGNWSRRGVINVVGQMLLFITIIDSAKAHDIAQKIHDTIEDHLGIITLSEVEVFRDKKF
ncbi:MAG: DUF190 domain-containing protein [Pseudomonadota bacterium]